MKHFKISEFDSPDEVGSGERMDDDVLQMIDKARELFGKPIHINSGVRTIAHNEKVGGSKLSSHLKGYAIDVSCDNSADRFRLIEILMLVGFNRLGIAKTFIHVDNDPDKSKNVIWVY
jgi:zinc D-Ala-D-Ala carboxypeptidase